jgi:4-amino-4-deoxy-L-arabinose transferase-like glycosyltransferase
VALWHLGRAHRWLAWLLPAAAAGTAVLARSLLGRTPGYAPGLGTGILVMAAAGALGLLAVMVLPGRGRALVLATGILALAGALAGPAAYSVSTVARTVDGTFATAGPEAAMRFAFLRAGVPVPQESVLRGELNPSAGLPPTGGRGLDGTGPGGGAEPGGAGTAAIDPRLVNFLLANRDSARFVVAVQGSQIAAPLILATGEPVVTMGGFNGSDPAPTLAQFQEMVALRQVRYVLLGNAGLGPAPGAFAAASAIARWVRGTGELVDPGKHASPIDGLALYQLW